MGTTSVGVVVDGALVGFFEGLFGGLFVGLFVGPKISPHSMLSELVELSEFMELSKLDELELLELLELLEPLVPLELVSGLELSCLFVGRLDLPSLLFRLLKIELIRFRCRISYREKAQKENILRISLINQKKGTNDQNKENLFTHFEYRLISKLTQVGSTKFLRISATKCNFLALLYYFILNVQTLIKKVIAMKYNISS